MSTDRRTSARLVPALAVVVALAGCSDDGTATTGTPPAGSSAPVVEELSRGTQDDAVDVEVDGPVQVSFRKITIPPGGSTGRHCHHGRLVGVVETGTLTHEAPTYPRGVHEYVAGDAIVEGPGYVHEGRNEGDEDVVLWVTYLTPRGEPLAETDLTACDRD